MSPDGTRLVFSSGFSGGLNLRMLNEYDAKPIAGSEGGRVPFFSPDGQWIAFAVDSKLKKVSVNGGAPVTIADTAIETPLVMQGHWGEDGTIVIAVRESGLTAVSAEGGLLRPLTTPDSSKGVVDHHSPSQLPGGALLYTLHRGPELFSIAVRTPAGDERVLLEDAFHARYLPTGHLVYGKPDGLYAAPFDLTLLALTGPPLLIVEGVQMALTSGTIQYRRRRRWDARLPTVRLARRPSPRVGRSPGADRAARGAAGGLRIPEALTRRQPGGRPDRRGNPT